MKLVSSLWSLGFLRSVLQVGSWDNVLRQVQVVSQELNTFLSQGVVVVLPGELGLDVALGGQGLQGLDDVQVLGVDLIVLWLVEVLLGDNHTLCGGKLVRVSVADGPACRNGACGAL